MNAVTVSEYPAPLIVNLPESPSMSDDFNRLVEAFVGVKPLKDIERMYVRYVLARCGGNVSYAAKYLGINRRTIQRWAKQP